MAEQEAPQARRTDIITSELDGELLIYDLTRHRAHCLNASAAFIWRHSDGQRSEAELARLWQETTGQPGAPEIVPLALRQLRRAHLLEATVETSDALFSRQELLRRAGLVGAAALLPAVISIVAPPAAYASSCTACGKSITCTSGVTKCCTGCTCQKVKGKFVCA